MKIAYFKTRLKDTPNNHPHTENQTTGLLEWWILEIIEWKKCI